MNNRNNPASLGFLVLVWTTLLILWMLQGHGKEPNLKTTDEIVHGSP